MNFKKNKKAKGFSLMETMLAGFLLTFGVVAVIGLLASSLKVSFDARNHDIAVLLAQEGIELARNVRDNSWASGDESFDNFPATSQTNCRIDKNSSDIKGSDCDGGFSSNILHLDGNNFYVYGGGATTRFSRKINISYFDNSGSGTNRDDADVMMVTSLVAWDGSFPSGLITYGNCNLASKCAFSQVSLSRWGE